MSVYMTPGRASVNIGSKSWQFVAVARMTHQLGLEVWTYDHHFDVIRVAKWR